MACMGVPGAVANERRELMRADRGDVAVVETNEDRSVFSSFTTSILFKVDLSR